MDYDAQSNQNTKKNTEMKRNIEEYEERIEILTLNLTTQEEKIFGLEAERETVLNQLREERESSYKKEKTLLENNEKL